MRFAFLCFSILLLGASLAASQDAAQPRSGRVTPPVVRTIKISRPNIEVSGSGLARVEIWIEPTGTGVGETLVGEAKRITPTGNHEKWIFPISSLPGYPHPVMAVNILAKGYNVEGKNVGHRSLGFNGVSELNTGLYGQIPE